jgi:hypothetical protein
MATFKQAIGITLMEKSFSEWRLSHHLHVPDVVSATLAMPFILLLECRFHSFSNVSI